MKRFACLPITLVTCSLVAQLWSPPGAVWNYNFQSAFADGCQTRVYVGDTVIDGRTAQQFHVTGHVLYHITGTITETDSYFHTSVEDSIVFAWTSLSGQWEWDTLYWFNAVPGDRWWPIGMDENYCGGDGTWGMLQVTDTGHVTQSGVQLRTVSAVYLDQFGDPGMSTITYWERLGSPIMVIPPGGCVSLGAWATIRTYQDNTFPLYDTGEPSPCDLFLGMGVGSHLSSGMILYPNPGETLLHAKWPGKMLQELEFRDALGRVVQRNAMLSYNTPIDVSGLVAGTYMIHVRTRLGESAVAKWTKQCYAERPSSCIHIPQPDRFPLIQGEMVSI